MFNRKNKIETPMLDEALKDCYEQLKPLMPDTKEYAATVKQIAELEKLRDAKHSKKQISPDTIVLVVANLAGILLVLNFERAGVITSKAYSMIGKLR